MAKYWYKQQIAENVGKSNSQNMCRVIRAIADYRQIDPQVSPLSLTPLVL